MNNHTLAKAYGQAFFKIAQAENNVDQCEEDFFYFKKTLQNNLQLRNFLKNPENPPSAKVNALKEIFRKSISPAILNELDLVIEGGRGGLLLQIAEEFLTLVSVTLDRVRVEVTTAVPLPPKLSAQLKNKLSHLVGRDVMMKVLVDESIIGGIIIDINGRIIDGSLLHRLEELREKLTRTAIGSE